MSIWQAAVGALAIAQVAQLVVLWHFVWLLVAHLDAAREAEQ